MIDFKDIKDLEKLMKLCRKQGVTELNADNLSMKFGDLPERQHSTVGAAQKMMGTHSPDSLMANSHKKS